MEDQQHSCFVLALMPPEAAGPNTTLSPRPWPCLPYLMESQGEERVFSGSVRRPSEHLNMKGTWDQVGSWSESCVGCSRLGTDI